MKLIACSGGPDSMLLLNRYKKKDIVVAHVNYHKREDSDVDQKIITDFCAFNNIRLEVFEVKQPSKGNFQAWARKIRYDFFKKVYDKYNCDELLIAHHKDDFLETALMQLNSNRTPRQFGMKQNNELMGMNIYRPFLHRYWKDDILKKLKSKDLNFAIDYTNELPDFERNKIRLELKKMSLKEKEERYSWFLMSNKILQKKFKKVDLLFLRWEKTDFSLKFIRSISYYREEIMFEFVNKFFNNIKLSSNKIQSLIHFVDGIEQNKEFKLNLHKSITKSQGKLIPLP